jgi:hypothetical protein
VSDTLHDTLAELLRSGSTSNPALNRLLDDYTNYHLALVVVGGLFLVGCIGLSAFSWKRFRNTQSADRKWTFEKRTFLSFATLGAFVSFLIGVVVAANLSNVLDPRSGFAGSLDQIRAAPPGTRTESLHQAFTIWLQSGSADTPTIVQRAIDDRLAWQQPKAIICTALFAALVWLSVHTWRTLIARSRTSTPSRAPRSKRLRATRWALVTGCLLLMLMVIGNTQASIAPLGLTLFNG